MDNNTISRITLHLARAVAEINEIHKILMEIEESNTADKCVDSPSLFDEWIQSAKSLNRSLSLFDAFNAGVDATKNKRQIDERNYD